MLGIMAGHSSKCLPSPELFSQSSLDLLPSTRCWLHVLLPSLHPSSQWPVSQREAWTIRPHSFFPHLLSWYRENSSKLVL